MTVFYFDNTFEGLLTTLFDAYARHAFPDLLLTEGEPLPLFYDEVHHVTTDEKKAERVWKGLQKKLSNGALHCLAQCWLAEEKETPTLLLQYMRQSIDSPISIETNFSNRVVLEFSKMWKRVNTERLRLLQFIRFQKAADGTFFAAIEPEKNALPLVTAHFQDRFNDQRWLIYDIKRQYGYYYDLKEVKVVTFDESERGKHLRDGKLSEELMDKDEKLFQSLWQTYFKAIGIKERLNPRKQKQDMPVRYWKYLTEKQ